MQAMEIIGWIAIGLVGSFGLVVTLTIIAQYLGVEFRTFIYRVDRAVEVRKEDIKAKSEAKKERLAKLRAIDEEEKDLKLANTIGKIKARKEEKRLRRQGLTEQYEYVEYIDEVSDAQEIEEVSEAENEN